MNTTGGRASPYMPSLDGGRQDLWIATACENCMMGVNSREGDNNRFFVGRNNEPRVIETVPVHGLYRLTAKKDCCCLLCLPSEGLGPKMCRSCVACIVPCQACATQWWCFGGCGRARYGLLFRWHHVSKNVKSWTRQDSEYFSCVVSFVSLHIIPLTLSSKRLFKHI
jgi:hypothetical protein